MRKSWNYKIQSHDYEILSHNYITLSNYYEKKVQIWHTVIIMRQSRNDYISHNWESNLWSHDYDTNYEKKVEIMIWL